MQEDRCKFFHWVDEDDEDKYERNILLEVMTENNMLLRENRELKVAQALLKCKKYDCARDDLKLLELEEKLRKAKWEAFMYNFVLLFVMFVGVLYSMSNA
ncbi:hypothetical protein V6N13_098588 [Hibiscus sabdariffa]|uniref:Zinc finger GRF-type domain-containing protein n=1 Tax=Hibiscus sabdariffa TaxID=183260 RepID=A0ABR2EFV0_9ROSI